MRNAVSPSPLAVLTLTIALGPIAMSGCDEASRARRADRSQPLERFELPVDDAVPARVFTSRRGPQPAGRPQPVFIEVQMRAGVLSMATQVSGVGGIKVVGGARLNHGSSGRTRKLERSITAALQPGSRGSLLVELAWRTDLESPERHAQLSIAMPAQTSAAKHVHP